MNKTFLLLAFIASLATLKAQPPQFLWAQSAGGTGEDSGNDIAVDPSGNTYITGRFRGTVDFDPGAGTVNLTSVATDDVFILKLDASGSLVWVKQFGGSASDIGRSIALDAAGNIFVTGEFSGTTDFDPGAGTLSLTSAGYDDIFISKLDPSGNLLWAKQLAGTSSNISYSIVADGAGNTYTTGNFDGTVDLDPGARIQNLTAANTDMFIVKLDGSGNLAWAKTIVGDNSTVTFGLAISIDATGQVYYTGTFNGTADFDPGAGTSMLLAPGGNFSTFVSKLDAVGNFAWAKTIGGTMSNGGGEIRTDVSGNVYVAGTFNGVVDIDPGAGLVNLTPGTQGLDDSYILKLDASGNFVWAKQITGASSESVQAMTLDGFGNIYLTGYFDGTGDFDPGAGTSFLTSTGAEDIFIAVLNSAGNFAWARSMGAALTDAPHAIVVDAAYNIYSTGSYQGTCDFDPDAGVFNLTAIGDYEIYIHKLSQSGVGILNDEPGVAGNIYPNPSNGLYTIELTAKAEISITNLLGETILTQSVEAGKKAIDLQQQPNGIYFVQVVSERKQQVSKMVKN